MLEETIDVVFPAMCLFVFSFMVKQRNGLVPRITLEAKLEIAIPDASADSAPNLTGPHMVPIPKTPS